MKTIGEVVRSLRLGKGMSLRALATEAGVSATYIDQIERGHRAPSAGIAAKLGAILGADPEWLLLLAGRVPNDILSMLRAEPELVQRIRESRL